MAVTTTATATMARRVQWTTELISEQFIVPRLEDELIDDLFYQEDEIGEMRHTAFMIECGLEEDPPDGPDVPPIPWGDMLLKQQQQKEEEAKPQKQSRPLLTDSDSDSDDEGLVRKEKRELPSRSRSTDDIDTLAIELTTSNRVLRRRPPTRATSTPVELSVPNSPLQSPLSPNEGPRKPARRVPSRTSPETPPRRKTPERRGLTKTRSGTTHGMAAAAARAKNKINGDDASQSPKSPNTLRKLSRTHSGTTREMTDAAAKFRKQKKDKEKIGSPSASERRKSIESIAHKNENKGRPAPLMRSFVATKSGTKFGNKNKDDPAAEEENEDTHIVYKNGKRTVVRRSSTVSKESRLKSRSSIASNGSNDSDTDKKKERRNSSRKESSIRQYSSMSSEDEDEKFLGELIKDSDDISVAQSEFSISTVGSDGDTKPTLPKSILQPLEMPIRQRSDNPTLSIYQPLELPTRQKSLTAKSVVSLDDETYEEELSVKKKEKKKKKKKGDGLSDDSSNHSTKSLKKKKKKKDRDDSVRTPRQRSKKKAISLDSSDDDLTDKPYESLYSQSPKETVEGMYGGYYASPSAIRKQNRLSLSRQRSDDSSPSVINIGSPRMSGSPSATSSAHRRQFLPSKISPTKKSLPFAPDYPPKSIIDIARQDEGLRGKPDDFVCTDPLAAIKQKKLQEKSPRASWSPSTSTSPFGSKKRPDDWLGSGKKAQRSWRVKAKPAD